MNDAVLKVAEIVRNEGGRALLVGGCVRDALLGEMTRPVDRVYRGPSPVDAVYRPRPAPKDFDIEVYGLAPDRLKAALSKSFKLDLVGASFGVLKLHGYDIDVALPRRETKLGEGHRAFEMTYDPFLTLEEASARRDFTVNAIYRDPLTGETLDPWNGRADLEKRVMRHVSDHFREDPLRVLRGMQFAARFDLDAAPETIEICRTMTPEGLAQERLMGEWSKLLLQGVRISKGLNFLRAVGWTKYYPELERLIGCEQDPHWHPEGDVWNHTLCCLDAFAKDRDSRRSPHPSTSTSLPPPQPQPSTSTSLPPDDLIVGLAVLCHDFGKPAATRYDPVKKRIRSLGHDEEGVAPTLSFLKRLTNEERLLKEVPPLVRLHMRPFAMWRDHSSDGAIRRLAREVVRIDRLIRVAAADDAGRPPYPSEPEPLEWLAAQAERLAVEDSVPKPILLGRHLIAKGLKPSPAFKKILDAAYEAQLDGAFSDLEGALKYIDTFVSNLEGALKYIDTSVVRVPHAHASPGYPPILLWDWNGTLLDDTDAAIASLNTMLARRGKAPVTRDFFRANFAFPSRRFYELVGMNVPDSEWDALAKEYHDTYHAQPYALNRDAIAALELAKKLGARQCILSALHQTFLDAEVREFGVAPFMERVCGSNNLDGGSKLARAKELVASLADRAQPQPSTSTFSTLVLIGDSLHDKEVADALGIRCVLFSGGSHSRERLEAVAPVGDTLPDCVRLALDTNN